MSTADRREQRKQLLDRIVTLQMQVQACPDAELREALAGAREALREHDVASLALFEAGLQTGRRQP